MNIMAAARKYSSTDSVARMKHQSISVFWRADSLAWRKPMTMMPVRLNAAERFKELISYLRHCPENSISLSYIIIGL